MTIKVNIQAIRTFLNKFATKREQKDCQKVIN